jgi:hypothetical protein
MEIPQDGVLHALSCHVADRPRSAAVRRTGAARELITAIRGTNGVAARSVLAGIPIFETDRAEYSRCDCWWKTKGRRTMTSAEAHDQTTTIRRPRIGPITRAVPSVPTADVSPLFRLLISGLFAANMILSVCLVRLGVGPLPVRVAFTLTAFLLIWAARPQALHDAVWLHRKAIGFISIVASVAGVVSVLNGVEFGVIVQQLAEIYGQAVFGILIGSMLFTVCGVNTVIYIFIGVVLTSTVVAILQFVSFEPAWQAYFFFQQLQPQSITPEMFWHDVRYRALGLSYTPVHLATQICMAFAAFYTYALFRYGEERVIWRNYTVLWVFFVVAMIGCIASGNRSPMLGLIAFMFFFLVRRSPVAAAFAAIGGICVLLFGDLFLEFLQSFGLRVLNTNNSSSEGRTALRLFGILLLFDNPLGYGVDFDSTSYWWLHWQDVQDLENPEAIMIHALHNYYLMILNKNGAIMLAFMAFVGMLLWKNKNFSLGLIPYIIHIFYHNDGPLQADFMFWYIYPLFQATYLKTFPSASTSRPRLRRRLLT